MHPPGIVSGTRRQERDDWAEDADHPRRGRAGQGGNGGRPAHVTRAPPRSALETRGLSHRASVVL